MVWPLEQHLSPTPGNLLEMQNLRHFPDQLRRNRFHKSLSLETTVLVLGDPRASPQAQGPFCTGCSLAPGSTFFSSCLPLTRCVPDAEFAVVGRPPPGTQGLVLQPPLPLRVPHPSQAFPPGFLAHTFSVLHSPWLATEVSAGYTR